MDNDDMRAIIQQRLTPIAELLLAEIERLTGAGYSNVAIGK